MKTVALYLHYLRVEVITHCQQLLDWFTNHYASCDQTIALPDRRAGFRLELELTEGKYVFEDLFEPEDGAAFADFYMAGYKCFYKNGCFFSTDENRQYALMIDLSERSVRANIGGRFAQSEEAFSYEFVRDLFKRIILPVSGMMALHGAVVTQGSTTVFLAGEKGAGKSTNALSFMERGYCLLADDSPLFTLSQGKVYALASLERVSITRETLAFFPDLRKYVHEQREISGKYTLSREFPPPGNVCYGPVEVTDYVQLVRGSGLKRLPLDTMQAMQHLMSESMILFRHPDMHRPPYNLQDVNALALQILSAVASSRTCQLEVSLNNLDRVPDAIAYSDLSPRL